ncbi:MAG TPA: Holliday junction resolvase RuvX [Candidatus Limnocylindrales bacterium]|nr:Holliday junction resolvase RuvX [Candidatus Limnocylindrales bacterium]
MKENIYRILGLDVGSKTIGIAVSDVLHLTAQGVGTIQRKSLKKDFQALSHVIDRYQIGEIVVGLPRNMNNSLGEQAEEILNFIARLKKYFKLPVRTWDERLTTIAADRVLEEAEVHPKKRKKVVDKIAAALILQGYLDFKKMGKLDPAN